MEINFFFYILGIHFSLSLFIIVFKIFHNFKDTLKSWNKTFHVFHALEQLGLN